MTSPPIAWKALIWSIMEVSLIGIFRLHEGSQPTDLLKAKANLNALTPVLVEISFQLKSDFSVTSI
jgi:hypothetical protein